MDLFKIIKNFVATKNTTFKINGVEELFLQAINITGKNYWKKCIDHVKNIMEKKCGNCTVVKKTVDFLIVNIGSDDEDSAGSE